MTSHDEPVAERARLRQEALDWLLLLTSGAATTADSEALWHWRDQSAAHEQAFVSVARFNGGLRQAAVELVAEQPCVPADLRRPANFNGSENLHRNVTVLTRRRTLLGGAIAASVAGYYMATRPPLGLWPSLQELRADYRTGTGERHDIALAQGISVELNTQTSISVPSGHARPHIDLISGEAIVTTRRDASTPVIVAAAGGEISSSAAEFDVRCDGAAVSVACLSGQVQVAHAGRRISLQAGQQSRYGDVPMQPAEGVDATQLTAWRSGLLIFHDQPLDAVIAELNRYRRGRIVLASRRLGGVLLNGVFHLNRLDDALEQIKALGVTATTLPGGLILLS